jgi:hypothetical protein
MMAQAAAADKSGDLLTMRESWESVQTLAKGYPLVDEAQTALMRVNDLGRARKNDLVAKIEQGDKRQNLFALDDLAFALGELGSADQVRNAVEDLLASAAFADLKEPLSRYRDARETFYKARRLAADGKRDQARRLLVDSAKRFSTTRFEADANKLLEELAKKPPAKAKKP